MTFVQFLLPNGRQRQNSIEVSPEAEVMAREVQAAGFRFEIELLATGDVSAECCDDVRELAGFVRENGPGMREAVEKLVHEAHGQLQILLQRHGGVIP